MAKAKEKGMKTIPINKTTGLSLNKPISKKSLAGLIKAEITNKIEPM
tara:strand:- start:106 stop:246 length:141 start_codon:yes stop_codon:yes gene_type:complete